MEFSKDITDAIIEEMKKSVKIAILTHRNADGDTLGAALALSDFFEMNGQQVSLFNPGNISSVFDFMNGVKNISKEFDPSEYDLVIAVDCAASYMTGFTDTFPELFQQTQSFINIDHHHFTNDNFGTHNLVIDSPSTTCIIFQLFQNYQIPITSNMATNLLMGLLGDTGSFMHSNTTSQAYRIASQLLARGAQLSSITREVFLKKDIKTLRVWGMILENFTLDEDGVVVVAVTEDDLKKFHATHEDISGVIDYLNSIQEAEYCLILTEKGKNVKGSLRTQKDVDVSQIAAKFGGGGHKKASGFVIPGKLKKRTIWEIVD